MIDETAKMSKYQPKGGMCTTCVAKGCNCSLLPFYKMPVLKTYPDGVHMVKCVAYSRGDF